MASGPALGEVPSEHPLVGRGIPTCRLLLPAKQNFTVAYDYVVERETIFVGAGSKAGADGAAREADTGRRLEHIGGKRAPRRVEFDLQVSGVRQPGNLVAEIEYHHIGHHSHQHRFFRQSFVLLVRLTGDYFTDLMVV
jgi:hypothetical protein